MRTAACSAPSPSSSRWPPPEAPTPKPWTRWNCAYPAGRAVTADDYQTLAQDVPGAGVARSEVLPLFKPQTRTPNIPGVVSVMVLPEKDGVQPPCPRADRPLLETVYAYLDPRRPATAEMYVIGTEYSGLGLAVAVEVQAGFGLLQIQQQVELALRNYLWPLA